MRTENSAPQEKAGLVSCTLSFLTRHLFFGTERRGINSTHAGVHNFTRLVPPHTATNRLHAAEPPVWSSLYQEPPGFAVSLRRYLRIKPGLYLSETKNTIQELRRAARGVSAAGLQASAAGPTSP